MSVRRLAFRNLLDGGFRSVAIVFGAALVAALALLATLVVRGAQANLEDNLRRLGADIVVFPWGTRVEEMEGGHLMQITTNGWMPRSYVQRISAVDGVAAASPQLFLARLDGSPYAVTAEMYVVAFDPQTDFALASWLDPAAYRNLRRGEAIGGSHIVGGDAPLVIDGYPLTLVGRLAPSGSDLDETLFVTFDTAADMATAARGRRDALIRISPYSATTALVRIEPGRDAREVAYSILDRVPGVLPIESAAMLKAQRGQIMGLLTTVLGLMATIWVLAIAFIGLVFTLSVNARRRQLGVLAALGAPRDFIRRSLLLEGAVLGLGGGAAGIAAAVWIAVLAGDTIVTRFGLPFDTPGPLIFAGLAVGGLLLAAGSVSLGVLLPAAAIARLDPAQAMRE